MVPLKYPGDFRSLIVGVISARRSSLLSATTRRLEDLINACQTVPANPPECCNPSAANTADSRLAVAEHQFVCRGIKETSLPVHFLMRALAYNVY